MGSIARMGTADRFREAFEQDYVARADLKPGMTLTVDRLGLGQDESDDSRLVLYAVLKDDKGNEHCLDIGQVLDCEYDHGDDLVERLVNALGLGEGEARDRLKKAGFTV